MTDAAVRERWPQLVEVLTNAAAEFGKDAAKELEVRSSLSLRGTADALVRLGRNQRALSLRKYA